MTLTYMYIHMYLCRESPAYSFFYVVLYNFHVAGLPQAQGTSILGMNSDSLNAGPGN